MKTSNILLSCLLAIALAFPVVMILGLRTKLSGNEYRVVKPDSAAGVRSDVIAPYRKHRIR